MGERERETCMGERERYERYKIHIYMREGRKIERKEKSDERERRESERDAR
jgi:hypothetical protein